MAPSCGPSPSVWWPGCQCQATYQLNRSLRKANRIARAFARLKFWNRSTAPADTNPPVNIFTMRGGMLVNHETALQIATVFACVRYIAESIGTLPWGVFQKRLDGGRDELNESQLYRLLHTRPNPEMAPMAFKETLTAWALTWGNGYAEIERDRANRPAALWPLTPDRVQPKRDAAGRLVYEVNNGSGVAKSIVPAANMYHLHGLGYDGLTGYSVVSLAARSIGTGLAADAFANSFYANNTVLGGVLKHPKALSDPAYDRLVESWQNRHKGPQKAYKPAILEEGMEWQSIGMPLKDAEFLLTRKFTVNEICRWFRVPPHKVADLERATYSNIESQAIEAVVDAIMPWAVRLEEEANFKLVSFRNQGSIITKLNLKGLMRGDAKTRAEYYQMMRNLGAFTINDILGLEDMNPIGPDGDVRVMQSQYVPIEMLGQQPTQPAPPGPGSNDDE